MTRPRHSVRAREEFVAAKTAAGWSRTKIAHALGIRPKTVTYIRTRLGITRPRPALSPAQVQRAEELLCQGASREEVARTFKVAHATIRRTFPHHRGWTPAQAIAHARLLREHRDLLL